MSLSRKLTAIVNVKDNPEQENKMGWTVSNGDGQSMDLTETHQARLYLH